MKTITEKQLAFIQRNKALLDDNKFGNPLDCIDVTKMSCYDASKLVGGMIGLIKINKTIARGISVSGTPVLDVVLDDVYDTIAKYQEQSSAA